MPNIPGQWFLKQDLNNCNSLFEALTLALFKPWREVTNLKCPNENFYKAYDDFLRGASADTCQIIKNIQFFHKCSEHARQHTLVTEQANDHVPPMQMEMDKLADSLAEENEVGNDHFEDLISEEDINQIIDQPYSG
jgi:hypothetical protein